MGAKNSTTMTNKTTTNVVNDFMQSISTDIENNNEAEMNMDQTLTFKMPFASMKDCNISIEQNQKGTLRATMDAMATLKDEQKAELAADISNAQSQALEQANSGVSVTPSENEANVHNEITTNVSNSLTTAIDKTFRNMNYAVGSTVQDATIDLEGLQCEGSDIRINQNQALEVIAENLAETIADSVQEGTAVTKVVNEQTQSVKQTNTGVGASGSGSSCSSSIVIVLLGVAAPKIKEMMEKKNVKVPGSKPGGGGGEPTPTVKLPEKKGSNTGLIIGILLIGFAILGIISYLIYHYTPKFPCPGEDDCSKAWDEIRAESPRVSPELLRKYHNCRIRHRHRLGIKPEMFRPYCESYCAYVTREGATPGFPTNPFSWLFCLDLLGKGSGEGGEDGEGGEGGEDGEDGEGGEDGDGDSSSLSALTEITNTQTQEEFSNYEPKKEPEGFGNYY